MFESAKDDFIFILKPYTIFWSPTSPRDVPYCSVVVQKLLKKKRHQPE